MVYMYVYKYIVQKWLNENKTEIRRFKWIGELRENSKV